MQQNKLLLRLLIVAFLILSLLIVILHQMVYLKQIQNVEDEYLSENEYTENAFLNNFYHYSSQILSRITDDQVVMKEIIKAESIQTSEVIPLGTELIDRLNSLSPDSKSIEEMLVFMNPEHRFINSYLSSLELVDLSRKKQDLAKYRDVITKYHDAQAHLLSVRNNLYELMKDYYNLVDIYACDEIHVVLSDGTNLLRMNHYNPERIQESYFGDNLLAKRKSLRDIHSTEIIKTFEVGPYHSQYRCIAPVHSNNRMIASIETGLGLKKIEQIVETTNPDIEILSIFPDMEEYTLEVDAPSSIVPCTFREGNSFYNFYQNRDGLIPLLNKRLTDVFFTSIRIKYLDYKRFSLEMRIENRDIVLLFNPVINYDNSPIGYILTVRDFSAKQGLIVARNKAIVISILLLFIVLMIAYFVQCRRSEKARFNQALGTVTEKLLEGIIVIKRDGKVKFVNRAGTIFLGSDRKSILDMNAFEVVSRIQFEEETSWEKIVEEIQQNGFYTSEDAMIKTDKASIAVSLLAVYINPTDNVTNDFQDSIVLVMNDITHHKIYENCLIAAKEEAETSDKLKSTFLNNFSHEIRTPLNSIVGFSYLLSHDNPAPELLARYVEVINKNSEYLLSVVQNIIEISQLERDEYRIYPEVFSLNSMMTELFNEYNEYIQDSRKPIKLFCKTGLEDGADSFMNDGKRLKQVMDYLLDNAVKFTELGHIEFGYRIHEKDTLLFWVRDTGIGIEDEEQSRIFKPFYQIKDGNHIKFSGTGLGLSIASKIVHLMGGNIWVKSEYTQGTTMYFALNRITQESLDDELASLGIEED